MTGNLSMSTVEPSGAVRVIGWVPFMRRLTLATSRLEVNRPKDPAPERAAVNPPVHLAYAATQPSQQLEGSRWAGL